MHVYSGDARAHSTGLHSSLAPGSTHMQNSRLLSTAEDSRSRNTSRQSVAFAPWKPLFGPATHTGIEGSC